MTEGNSNNLQAILGIVVLVGLGWFFFGGGLEHQANKDLKNIQNKVAIDTVEQYNIAKKQGDKIQICVQAGMASAAYLQVKDESNYSRWKEIEAEDCKRAGISK